MPGRDIDAAAAAAAAARSGTVGPIGLARLAYDSADLLVTSAPFDILWDWDGDGTAERFHGVGALGKISPAQEATDIALYTLTLQLSGIPPELIGAALSEHYQGRDARVWAAFLDHEHTIIGAPVLIWRGRMDTQDIEMGVTATIEVSVISPLAKWEEAPGFRYTAAEQQSRFPDDRGLEFVPQMVAKEIIWGQ